MWRGVGGGREMTQWLRALATIPEILGSISSIYGGSQPSVTPVFEDLTHSSNLHEYQEYTQCTDIHAGKIPKYIK
jgi:hypothetical protein